MRYQKQRSHVMDLLFVIALFGVFAVCAFIVTLIGANVYKNVTDAESGHSVTRTASAYLLQKVRTGDSGGSVSAETQNGIQALTIRETIDGTEYVTYIYCHDGKLKELFEKASGGFAPEKGTDVMELSSMAVEQDGPMLRFAVAEGTPEESRFSAVLLSEGGGTP